MSKLQTKFAERVKELMDDAGMTAYRLSKESGIAQSTLSRLFSGNMNPTLELMEGLSSALGVEVKDLFDFETEKDDIPPHLLKIMRGQDKAFYEAVESMAKALRKR